MKFVVKDMDIATGGTLIAILHQKDAKKLDLRSSDRIVVKSNSREVTCILDISQNNRAVPEGHIGLLEEVLSRLHVRQGAEVNIHFTGKPESVQHIRDKLEGKHLNYEELFHIIDDITHDRLTDIEKTYFVAAGFTKKFTLQEIVDLTKAMVAAGKKLTFHGTTVDKHSIGGVPGNRTTMILVPVLTAAGLTMPKTSSRAITSPAGTADTMECLANVELNESQIKQVVRKIGGCIVHGGALQLAPADDKIINVEHPLSIDAEGQLLASVMAKKYSVSARHVLIDIPMGKNTKAPTLRQAHRYRKLFQQVGKKLGMHIKVIITDGSQPIGNGIGPLLEAEDVLSVLRNDPLAPQDLRKKALMMAALLLEMTGKYKDGTRVARELLESGQAYQQMQRIITAQGRKKKPALGSFRWDLVSKKSGRVVRIDNEIIAKAARIAGAPDDQGAGLYLRKKAQDQVTKEDVLFTVYAESAFKLQLAQGYVQHHPAYEVT